MKSQALHELVKRIFNDEKTRQQFIANPDSVLSQYTLTEQEKKAVLNTSSKLGVTTRNSQQLEAIVEPLDFWF